MIKVYLDTNVLIGLKNQTTEEFKKLKQLLSDLKGRIYCFYSIAHLNDLTNDKTGRIKEELEFIEQIVENNFLIKEWGENRVDYRLYFPKNAFEIYQVDSDLAAKFDFDDIDISEDFNENERLLIQYLKDLRLNFDFKNNLGQNEELDAFLYQYFGDIKDEYTMDELMKQFASFYKMLFQNPQYFKNLRRSVIEKLPLKQKWDVNIEDLNFNEKLENTPLAKSFFQFVKDSMYNKEDDPNYSYDFFTNSYYLLNILGIDGEKNKGVKFANTLYDSFHSYYAAHCHFLVTNDQGLLAKSNTLYKFYGIDTKALNVSNFIQKIIIDIKKSIFNANSFLDTVVFHAENSVVIRESKSIQFNRTYKEIRVNPWLIDYFSKLEAIEDWDEGNFLVFSKDFRYFNRIETWKDFESVTNQLINIFGADINFKTDFHENDKIAINNGNWHGRVWNIGKIIMYLEINEGTKLFSFVIKL